MHTAYRASAVLAGLLLLSAVPLVGGTFEEDFSSDPLARGWRAYGNEVFFQWSPSNQCLQVTWDSSQPNSYYWRPLGTILRRSDDFSLQFDLRLLDISTGSKPGPFEIAVALLNLADATRPGFYRGAGVNDANGPRNLFEFDYFTAGYYPGFGDVQPSISPTLVSSNNQFASGFTLVGLTNGFTYRIRLEFSAASQVLRTSITCNGTPIAGIGDVPLGSSFSDFRLDTLAVASYSDAGDDFDSVLAHGSIDNVQVITPPAPVQFVRGGWSSQGWKVEFATQPRWSYYLERTADLGLWETLPGSSAGDGTTGMLTDTNPPVGGAMYRVRAELQ